MFKYLAKHFSRVWLLAFSIDFLILLLTAVLVLKTNNSFFGIGSAKYYHLGYLYLIVFIFISQIMLFINDLYSLEKKYKKKLLLFKCIISFTIVSISCYLLFSKVVSYSSCFILSMIACVSILCWRSIFYWITPKMNLQHKLLFLGTDELCKQVVREILADDRPKFRVAGFIGSDPALVGKSIVNPKVLGLNEDIESIIQKEKVKKVIASYSQARGKFPAQDLVKCKFKGIEVLDLHTFYEQFKGKILLDSLRPSWIIYAQGFKKTALIKFLKRIIDIPLSIIGLLLTLPLSLITAVLIKFESKGPVIYQQERVGENGAVFNLYKFRSMEADAEKDTGPVWTKEDDERSTLIGKFIRRIRIDEIPQMINVLKGDMSFIGPRPERPYFVEILSKKISYYDQRHSVKPGITGWAAVNYSYGANVEDAIQKLQYDLYYIKNISLFLDMIIFLKTIAIVIGGRGSR